MPAGTPINQTIDITITTLITAIGTAVAAFTILQPKFAQVAKMRRETKSLGRTFILIYFIPQVVNALFVLVIVGSLFAALASTRSPQWFSAAQYLTTFASFMVLENLVWILLLATVFSTLVQFNYLCWVALWSTAIVAWLPIPRLRGAWGKVGRSAGWHHAYCVCASGDKASPLLIDDAESDRLANRVLLALATLGPRPDHFAATPTGVTPSVAANLALFGCILERIHYDERWTTPRWGRFYTSLQRVHCDHKVFEPLTLVQYTNGREFFEVIRNGLLVDLRAANEPVPDDTYLAAASDVAEAWELLRRYNGDLLAMIPPWTELLGDRLFWLDRRLAQFPRLDNVGMRPQLIKLLVRWGLLPWAKSSVFLQPMARRQAWLMLQWGTLRVLPSQSDVTFLACGDVAVSRIAALRVVEQVTVKVRRKASAEAAALDATYPGSWDVHAAADFAFWNLAEDELGRGRAEAWEAKEGWRWRFDGGRATKVS